MRTRCNSSALNECPKKHELEALLSEIKALMCKSTMKRCDENRRTSEEIVHLYEENCKLSATIEALNRSLNKRRIKYLSLKEENERHKWEKKRLYTLLKTQAANKKYLRGNLYSNEISFLKKIANLEKENEELLNKYQTILTILKAERENHFQFLKFIVSKILIFKYFAISRSQMLHDEVQKVEMRNEIKSKQNCFLFRLWKNILDERKLVLSIEKEYTNCLKKLKTNSGMFKNYLLNQERGSFFRNTLDVSVLCKLKVENNRQVSIFPNFEKSLQNKFCRMNERLNPHLQSVSYSDCNPFPNLQKVILLIRFYKTKFHTETEFEIDSNINVKSPLFCKRKLNLKNTCFEKKNLNKNHKTSSLPVISKASFDNCISLAKIIYTKSLITQIIRTGSIERRKNEVHQNSVIVISSEACVSGEEKKADVESIDHFKWNSKFYLVSKSQALTEENLTFLNQGCENDLEINHVEFRTLGRGFLWNSMIFMMHFKEVFSKKFENPIIVNNLSNAHYFNVVPQKIIIYEEAICADYNPSLQRIEPIQICEENSSVSSKYIFEMKNYCKKSILEEINFSDVKEFLKINESVSSLVNTVSGHEDLIINSNEFDFSENKYLIYKYLMALCRKMTKIEKLDFKTGKQDLKIKELDYIVEELDTKIETINSKIEKLNSHIEKLDIKIGKLDFKIECQDLKIVKKKIKTKKNYFKIEEKNVKVKTDTASQEFQDRLQKQKIDKKMKKQLRITLEQDRICRLLYVDQARFTSALWKPKKSNGKAKYQNEQNRNSIFPYRIEHSIQLIKRNKSFEQKKVSSSLSFGATRFLPASKNVYEAGILIRNKEKSQKKNDQLRRKFKSQSAEHFSKQYQSSEIKLQKKKATKKMQTSWKCLKNKISNSFDKKKVSKTISRNSLSLDFAKQPAYESKIKVQKIEPRLKSGKKVTLEKTELQKKLKSDGNLIPKFLSIEVSEKSASSELQIQYPSRKFIDESTETDLKVDACVSTEESDVKEIVNERAKSISDKSLKSISIKSIGKDLPSSLPPKKVALESKTSSMARLSSQRISRMRQSEEKDCLQPRNKGQLKESRKAVNKLTIKDCNKKSSIQRSLKIEKFTSDIEPFNSKLRKRIPDAEMFWENFGLRKSSQMSQDSGRGNL